MSDYVDVLITVPFPEEQLERLRQVSSRLRIMQYDVAHTDEIPPDAWRRAEVLYTAQILPTPEQAPNLRWLQFHLAAIDFALESEMLRKQDLVVTTLSGVAAPQVGEYVVMMLLGLGHGLPEIFALNAKANWPRDRWERFKPSELRGSTVGLVGYGSINREVARLLHAFGVTVLATKRDVLHPEDNNYMLNGLGDPQGDYFTRLYPYKALSSMLKVCDYVVVAVPLTSESRGLISARELKVMKSSAFLVNLGRAGVVDEQALLEALQEKRLAGAALDVFAEEPLPETSPFWRLPNAIISPHIAGISSHYMEQSTSFFIENLQRYLENTPLLNRFDPERGY
ncbi:MAG TPA: D-2-hydroxyacid dehydrogenase [Longilinea sp.]|nr:D-2-hydroxyacid dehydrogenase [Longilinea sp.]